MCNSTLTKQSAIEYLRQIRPTKRKGGKKKNQICAYAANCDASGILAACKIRQQLLKTHRWFSWNYILTDSKIRHEKLGQFLNNESNLFLLSLSKAKQLQSETGVLHKAWGCHYSKKLQFSWWSKWQQRRRGGICVNLILTQKVKSVGLTWPAKRGLI